MLRGTGAPPLPDLGFPGPAPLPEPAARSPLPTGPRAGAGVRPPPPTLRPLRPLQGLRSRLRAPGEAAAGGEGVQWGGTQA